MSARAWAGPHADYDPHRMYSTSHQGCCEAKAGLPPERSGRPWPHWLRGSALHSWIHFAICKAPLGVNRTGITGSHIFPMKKFREAQ